MSDSRSGLGYGAPCLSGCLRILRHSLPAWNRRSDGLPLDRGTEGILPVVSGLEKESQTVLLTWIEDASAGWKKRAPGFSRPAPPASGVHALSGSLMSDKKVLEAVAVELSFSGYLRPMDLVSLKVKELVPPQPLAGATHNSWALLLHSVDTQSRPPSGTRASSWTARWASC